MKLYHVTTPKKVERYVSTGAIIPPVRGFSTRERAEEWGGLTGRTIILEIEGEPAYPLPDHRPNAYWIDDFIRDWNPPNRLTNPITMKKKEWKDSITKNDRLKLIGLMTVGIQHQKLVTEIEGAMAEIIGYHDKDIGSNYAHLLSDELYELRGDVDRVLKNLEIKVTE